MNGIASPSGNRRKTPDVLNFDTLMQNAAKPATSASQSSLQIGFIGAGRMATALACGLIESGFAAAGQILASDVVPQARDGFARSAGLSRCSTDA